MKKKSTLLLIITLIALINCNGSKKNDGKDEKFVTTFLDTLEGHRISTMLSYYQNARIIKEEYIKGPIDLYAHDKSIQFDSIRAFTYVENHRESGSFYSSYPKPEACEERIKFDFINRVVLVPFSRQRDHEDFLGD